MTEVLATTKVKKSVIEITEAAADRIKFLLEQRSNSSPDKPSVGIKVRVKTGGCSGLSYVVEYADKIDKFDEVIIDKDVTVVIEAKAIIYLIGTTMDYFEEELKSGFVFVNPNEKGRCGCGESFHI